MKTLIVEDDGTSRAILQAFLKDRGPIVTATNGREALEAFRGAIRDRQPFRLVSMDIMMPEMDGIEALQRIRDIEDAEGVPANQRVKVIIITVLSDRKNICDAHLSLCDAYLIKPISQNNLHCELRKLGLME